MFRRHSIQENISLNLNTRSLISSCLSRHFSSITILLGFCALPIAICGQSQTTLPIMPLPASAIQGQGEFLLDGKFVVAIDGFSEPRLLRARQRFMDVLFRETGIPFGLNPAATPVFHIEAAGPSATIEKLGEDESYHLEVAADSVRLKAANPLGILHGLQTFLQLVHVTPKGFAVPAVTIDDKPRFPWRGLMIDSGRHFIALPVIERNLDAMEAVKLNVFHWHLSDDQGFRVESKAFPLLHQKGSDGLYYTQDQVRHIIEYARDRGIRVIPEFDMPGHSMAWFVGYPQLGSGKGPYSIERGWGVFDTAMDPTRESTYQFLNLFLGEMTSLFPDAYFHIGGDECNGKEWDANPRIQEFKQVHNLKDNAALQAYFTGRVQKLVTAHHKITEGWDEVLQPDTPKDVVIQSWRGRDSLLDAAKRGYRGLLSNGYYIDLNHPAEEHYIVDPLEGIADKLTPEQASSILGGEATMWSEWVNSEIVDSRIWPRTAAIAERYWSPQSVRDIESMYTRMAIVDQKLKSYGIDHQANSERMLQRMSGDANPVALRVLASVVEPPKGYTREGLAHHTSLTPLNELVDAVSPESETARQFREIAKRIAAGSATPEEWQRAHDMLVLWRDNHARLQPRLAGSEIMMDLAPLSESLSQVASIGLEALDNYRSGTAMTVDAKSRSLTQLATAVKPQAQLILMVVPPVELLVKSAKTQ
jgi:hexosaminidase